MQQQNLLTQEDKRLFELDFLALHIRYEMRADEPTVKPHPFSDLHLVLDGPAFLAGDDAFFADLLHSLCNEVANVDIPVR